MTTRIASAPARVNLLGEHFQPGDVIYTLNGQPVKGLRGLKSQVKELDYGKVAVFHVERGGMQMFVKMQVE